jgi:hypothetical protein
LQRRFLIVEVLSDCISRAIAVFPGSAEIDDAGMQRIAHRLDLAEAEGGGAGRRRLAVNGHF